MAIFTRYALTRKGQQLIAKAQADLTNIEFTEFVTGSGLWEADEDLEYASELKEPRQQFSFSDISIPSGNPSTVVVTVNISNENLTQLYYLNEAGIMARDPDEGTILYAILAAETEATYVPAYNGTGYSNIVQRINLEVANSSTVIINMDGAHVSAAEYTAFRNSVLQVIAGLAGGTEGQFLRKRSDLENEFGWANTPVVSRPLADFPEEGMADAVYIDTDSAEIYVWMFLTDTQQYGYFKLPLGSEASETLQAQITANRNNITSLQNRTSAVEGKLSVVTLTVPAANWEEGTDDGKTVYTQEITVSGMTATTDAGVWSNIIADTAAGIVAEKKAASLFFGKGIIEGLTGKIRLKCYERCPAADFGIKIQGVSAS